MNNIYNFKHILAAVCMTLSLTALGADSSTATKSDSWELTDALGRKARSYEDAGDRDSTRFVGMFYWTWHQDHNPKAQVRNITEVLRQYPEAINDRHHPAWGEGKSRPSEFYWDEPLFGYYRTTDPWVLRKHAEMLADAGVDAVFFDCTNGSIVWEESYRALLQTWEQARKDGVNVPKVVFMLPFAATADSKKSLINLYTNLYSKGEYQDLWFYWKGKPLIMAYPDNLSNKGVEKEIKKFFTFRPGQPDYVFGPAPDSKQWGWLEVYPTHGYAIDKKTGKPEQCTVGIAQNAGDGSHGHCCAFTLPETYGRSYSRLHGFDRRPDAYLYGANFQEQWDRAIDTIQPEMVFVTGWNEWTSGMWTKADGWSDPLSFVDQYNWDHSRDIEPTLAWGDKGDVYYQQLVDNVRRFKGMAKPADASAAKTIKLGKPGEWDDVQPRYTAYRGNTMHRDHRGRYDKYYTDASGRNDIVGAQVAHDAKNIYFRVESAEALTPATDPNWMMLFIDIDRDKSTGWNGYDFVINRKSPANGKATIEKCNGDGWYWQTVAEVPCHIGATSFEVAVPKIAVGQSGAVDFEFKWSDNMQQPGNVLDFYISGDSAPGGRFNYRYKSIQ